MTEGLRIISDGTDAGTHLIIDGHPMTGVSEVHWKINPATKRAEICLSLSDLSVSGNMLPPQILWALDNITRTLMEYEDESVESHMEDQVRRAG